MPQTDDITINFKLNTDEFVSQLRAVSRKFKELADKLDDEPGNPSGHHSEFDGDYAEVRVGDDVAVIHSDFQDGDHIIIHRIPGAYLALTRQRSNR